MNAAVTPSALAVLAAVFGALILGSIVRLVSLRSVRTAKARKRRASLLTWWILAVLLAAAVLTGPLGVCVLLGLATWLGFSEYRSLEATDEADRFASGILQFTIPVVFLTIYLGWGLTALALLPLLAVLVVATSDIVHGVTRGYVRSIGALVFGAVVLIGGLGHAAEMVAGPAADNAVGGKASWFIFLVVLTEVNDISQALVGRRIGSRHITPKVSPNKTTEGLVGGVLVTAAAALALAPLLTPLTTRAAPSWTTLAWLSPWVWPLMAGLAIALAGFLGDLNMSAIKRDAGVKDSSGALPGMGGVLDRIDSLTLTAPVFYWLIVVPTS
jgi:phosphatidate cytidylyltransferase